MRIPNKGQKIRFANPAKIHWFTNVVDDQKLLEVGAEYTVDKIHIASSATYVWLEEIECYDEERELPFFNLHSFEWEDEEEDEGCGLTKEDFLTQTEL